MPRHVCLTLPPPVSANRYWRKYNNRMVVSAEARAYKQEVALLAAQQIDEPMTGSVSIYLDVYRQHRRGDLDNRLKVVLDSLQGIVYHDDKQIAEIHVVRHEDRKNPRVEVQVSEY